MFEALHVQKVIKRIHKTSLKLSSALAFLCFAVFITLLVFSPFAIKFDLDISPTNEASELSSYLLVFGVGSIIFYLSFKQKLIGHYCLIGVIVFSLISGSFNWYVFAAIFVIVLPLFVVLLEKVSNDV